MSARDVLRRSAPPLAALAVALVAGCSSGSDPLVEVRGRRITVDEFKAVARGNESQYPGPPDSAKAEMLDDMTRRLLLLAEAEQRGMFDDTLTVNFRLAAEERALTQELLRRMAPQPAVSEAEVAQLAAWRDTVSHLQLIYTATRPGADAALAELRRGEPFEEVANRHNITGMLPPGGDLGPLLPGSLVAPLDRWLRRAPVGEIVGPLAAPGEGWFLLRVLERRRNENPEGATAGTMLGEMIRQRKQRIAQIAATVELRESWRYRPEPDGAQLLFQRFNRLPDPRTGQLPPVAEPSPEDARLPLATWDGGVYTLGDAFRDLERPDERPDFNMVPAIRAWMEAQVTRRIAVAEAKRRLIHEEPEVRRRIDQAVDNYVLDAIYQSDVLVEARLEDRDLRAYFDARRDDYRRLDGVELETATFGDSTTARRAALAAAGAGSLAEAVAAVGSDVPVATRTVTYPTTDGLMHFFQSTFAGAAAGEIVGPQPTGEGWLVMRLVAKRDTPLEFDQLPGDVAMRLRADAQELKREEAFRRVTDHLRRLFAPRVHPERLKRVRWPIEAEAPPAT